MDEPNLAPLLRNTIKALMDPTRGAILVQLGRAGEMTATQLARSLGLSANTIYHHMSVLTQLGLLEPPRIVPGKTYIEKYYRVKHEVMMGTRDPGWVDRVKQSLTMEERKEFLIGTLLRASQILRQAAQRYEHMDAQVLDELFSHHMLGIVSINQIDRDRLQYRMAGLREVMSREADLYPDTEDESSATDMVIVAGLPLFWEAPERAESERRADESES